jgi:hypothetical protein
MTDEKFLWTADGLKTITGKAPARVEMKSTVIEWFRQFADVASHFNLGIHCAQCGNDVIGRNLDSDRTFSFTCGCREFIGRNRDYVAPTEH